MSGKLKLRTRHGGSTALGTDDRCQRVTWGEGCQGRSSRGVLLVGFCRVNRSLPIDYRLSTDREGREEHSGEQEQHL